MPALPLNRDGFFADLVLITAQGTARVVSEGFDLASEEEVFFLNVDEYNADTYWQDEHGRPAWPMRPNGAGTWSAVDLVKTMFRSTESLLKSTRRVRLFRDTRVPSLNLPPKGVMQSAAAVCLEDGNGASFRVLIYATPEISCSLEVTTEPSRINAIIAALEEFHLTKGTSD